MKAEKIGKVAIVAKSAEQKSARALQESHQRYQQDNQQLDQLIAFKQEYEANFAAAGDRGIAAKQLQDYRVFLSKLNQAIDVQGKAVQLSLESMEAVREQWLSRSRHCSSLDKLLDKRRSESLRTTEKAEQKESDERSMMSPFTLNEF